MSKRRQDKRRWALGISLMDGDLAAKMQRGADAAPEVPKVAGYLRCAELRGQDC